jgi:3-deoxy-D-manno-octulosonate 8-phosphate phosphatase (KDO 8-P phosphatase)
LIFWTISQFINGIDVVETEFKNKTQLKQSLKKVRILIMDVDGVLTDGSLIIGTDGQEYKVFSVQDGMGMTLAHMGGLKVGIISGKKSKAVEIRAQELHLDVIYQGFFKKIEPYFEILESYNYEDENVCFIGDDILDLSIMKRVGVSIAVANARDRIKKEAHYVTKSRGGQGAVREAVELILKAQGKWNTVIEKISSDNL